MSHQLRVQISLNANWVDRRANGNPAGGCAMLLRSSGKNFPAAFFPTGPLVAGGSAVHGSVTLDDPDAALGYFPPGTQFEIWEDGRKGYGSVLGWT